MDEHKITLEEFYERVGSPKKGLSSKDADERRAKYGYNILEAKKNAPLIVQFLKEFTNFFALLLIVGACLAFFAEHLSPGEGNMYIGIALIAVVILNAIFTFIQKYQSEKIMESFKKMMPDEIDVLRDGRRIKISAKNIVPGDVIFLSEGDKIPADARLIEQNVLKVDHSSLTGESEPQLRKLEFTHENILESRNMVFSGTLVQSGNGKAVVYCTGMNTQIGKIVRLTKETKEVDTPLHRELSHFIKIISSIAMFLGTTFFIISFLLGNSSTGALIFAIGIIVANVPEGLLPTVTLALSMAAKRMAKKNALIKNLESVETLGSTTVICTDKTGTLTENKMSVNTIYLNLEGKNVYEKDLGETKNLNKITDVMTLCNNARTDPENSSNFIGDPTETALLNFSKNFIDIDEVIEKEKRIHESPFDSKTRRMITTNLSGLKKIAYMKGAPEVVLNMCSGMLLNDEVKRLTPKKRDTINKYYEKLASRGERVLAFAYKETEPDRVKECDFIFIGLSGMLDPPRKEVPEAIKKCRTAGIKVIMITGDFGLTAEAVARKIGLVDHDKANMVIGELLDKLDDEQLKQELKKNNIIFARANPLQKLRIVKTLQSMGEVVTVTGDGVNDAPALKNADMGVSMGISGTEVAREASDMVLMDDNFATIVSAVEEGRTIFENIKKFIAYILTSNVPQILPFIAFVLLSIPLPLTVILILAIDLGSDILPAIGLGTERPESDVMKKKPRSRKERLLTTQLLFISYGIIGMIQAAAGFFTFFYILCNGGWMWGQELAFNDPLYMKAVAGFFASIVICQIADVMICRTRRQSIFKAGFLTNKIVILGIITELALLWIIIYFPPAQQFFGTNSLTLFELSLAVPFALLILFGDEVRKFFVRRDNEFVKKYLTW